MRYISVKDKLLNKHLTKSQNSQVDFKLYMGRGKNSIESVKDIAFELIRKKAGVTDIEVVPRRMTPVRNPDSLWDVHLDNGIVTVAKRPFVKKRDEGWKDILTIGSGIACSICFDGYWVLKNSIWRFVTEEDPWIFYVDNSNNLWARLFDFDIDFTLASDVLKVKSIRGWKSTTERSKDLGLIVVYLKTDGKLYYRNYCEQEDGQFFWENEREFDYNETVSSFNLFETNDYRIGAAITDTEGKTKVYFSKRNWAGMGIRPDYVSLRLYESLSLVPVTISDAFGFTHIKSSLIEAPSVDYAGKNNEVLFARNEADSEGNYGKIVVFGCLYKLYKPVVHLTDSEGKSLKATDVEFVGRSDDEHFPFVYKARFTNFNSFKGECTLKVQTENAIGEEYEISGKFTPVGLNPSYVPEPKVISLENTDNTLVLKFDQIVSGGAESVSAFKITSTAFKSTNTKEMTEDIHTVKSISNRDEFTVVITVNERFRRAIDITVSYKDGALSGVGGAVKPFELTVKARIESYSNDILDSESVELSMSEQTENVKVDFIGGFGRDYIRSELSEVLEFRRVEGVDP